MQTKTKNCLFTGLGFLIGTIGLKAATSQTAKKGYVHAMAQGMKAKAEYNNIVEQAKAEFDDMKAEAEFIAVSDKDVEKAEKAAK
ncbi:MAG: DUF1490 domain-containing protein [Coriobacteriaceae bacterium]|jgi:hypothetical protein|nr:DUF1490 domain-containing protein [Coriobacteriaceae bacterium]